MRPLQGHRLENLLKELPARSGVYLMKDLRGRVIYVGKAKNLRTRLKSYFRASGDTRAFVSELHRVLGDIEIVVTPSEKDALILEREFIGRFHPIHNIDLRDDKSFLVIRVTDDRPFPRMMLDRRRLNPSSTNRGQGRWFGPYTSAMAARETFRLLQGAFQVRNCPNSVFVHRQRPCLQYQMGRCLGPCVAGVSEELYSKRVNQTIRFLQGHFRELEDELENRMREASKDLRFEDAARLRDRLQAARQTLARQEVVDETARDRDVVGMYREGASGVVLLLQIRGGCLIGATRFPYKNIETPNADILRQFLGQHYGSGADLPAEILIPGEAQNGAEDSGDLDVLADWLSENHGSAVKLIISPRGKGSRLIQMAAVNAQETFRLAWAKENLATEKLQRLKSRLGLSNLPRRVECFDLSTLGGQSSVGSMAVLIDGEPSPGAYRRYRIREAPPDSDVDMMREVIGRRFRSVLQKDEEAPDLVVLDGGIGQLNVIRALFADSKIKGVDLVALAKGRKEIGQKKALGERIYVPGRKNPIFLKPGTDELFLLSRIRDEAHRFAVQYHRKLRKKSALRTVLDEVPGVGLVLRKRLLSRFGSVRGVSRATVEELAGLPGISKKLANQIVAFFSSCQPDHKKENG